ncbi:MAG: hypothetical protein R6U02_01615 [Alkalibacterium sp.]|uniref:hypothetical protein n=1 Tax=Alkalibacterium sp. TaxID=1872447 RepID=UPI00397046C5
MCQSRIRIVDFKQNMGFKGSFNRNYLRMKEQNIDTKHVENDKRKLKRTKRRKSRIKTGVKLLITTAILFIVYFLYDLADLTGNTQEALVITGMIGGLLALGFVISFILGVIFLIMGFATKK